MKCMLSVLTVFCLLMVFATGCATTSGSVLSPSSSSQVAPGPPAASKIQIKNMAADPIYLSPGGRTVFIYWTNTTGISEVDCQQMITQELVSKGYVVVNSVQEADYILKCQLTYFDLMKNHPQGTQLMQLATVSGMTGIGAAIGNNNGSALGGAVIGGLVGVVVSEVIKDATAQDLFYCELGVQIEERINFLGAPAPEPIKSYDKVTVDKTKTKNGKTSTESKIIVRNGESLDDPTEETESIGRSGENNTRVVKGVRKANFNIHQTKFQTAVQFAKRDRPGAVESLRIYLARSIAGNFGPASMN